MSAETRRRLRDGLSRDEQELLRIARRHRL
jgi:hypothetical protein